MILNRTHKEILKNTEYAIGNDRFLIVVCALKRVIVKLNTR